MLKFIRIYNLQISTYGLLALCGTLLGLILAMYLTKYHKISKEDVFYCFFYEMVMFVIGAKLLWILENLNMVFNNFSLITSSGVMLIGGVLGGILGIYIYSKQYNILFKDLMSALIITFPAIYALSKVGCFLAGCCYEIECRNGLLPIQLIESFISFIICFVLCKFYNVIKYKIVGIYLILLSLTRFCSDFFRGEVKSIIGILSMTQFICIILFIIGILVIFKELNVHIKD